MDIVGCFLECDGKFVILRRREHKPDGGTWGLPAGKVGQGEARRQAALRELFEETGVVAEASELHHAGTFQFGPSDKRYDFTAYRVQSANRPAIRLEDQAHDDYQWVTAGECYARADLIADFHELLLRLDMVTRDS